MTDMMWMAIILCGLLFCFLCWKETRRINRTNLIWRLFASLMTATSLALCFVPAYYSRTMPENTVILLTKGFEKAESFPGLNDGTVRKLTLDMDLYQRGGPGVQPELVSSTDLKNVGQTIQVLGNGLNQNELNNLNDIAIDFLPPAKIPGVESVSWTKKLRKGERFRVQGRMQMQAQADTRIMLFGNGTVLDSITLKGSDTTKSFDLMTVPRLVGKAVYQLIVWSGKDTLSADPVPLEVGPAEPLRILVVNNAPSFEARFLKNWLSDNKYAVRARTRITTGKFSNEILNTPLESYGKISAGLLSKTDIIIADAAELRAMTADELAAIRSAVVIKGKGLLVRGDSLEKGKSFYAAGFNPGAGSVIKPVIRWGNRADEIISLPTPVATIRNTAENQSLVLDETGASLAGSRLLGAGKIVYTTLDNTYLLELAGNHRAYQSLWSYLLGKTAGTGNSKPMVLTRPAFPTLKEPVELVLSDVNPGKGRISAGDFSLAPAGDMNYADQISATFWPDKSGWLKVTWADSLKAQVYIFPEGAWSNLVNVEKRTATIRYARMHSAKGKGDSGSLEKSSVQIPKAWFFALFLIAVSFLWLENKYAGLA